MKKILAILAIASSIALTGAAPALAYPASELDAGVDDSAVAPGEPFTFSGSGMTANEPVDVAVTETDSAAPAAGTQSVGSKINIFLAPQTFSTKANPLGEFSIQLSIAESGRYAITGTGRISGTTVGPVFVDVDPSFAEGGAAVPVNNTAAGAPLANTGADASLLLWGAAGVGAMGLGAAGVIVSHRKKNAVAA